MSPHHATTPATVTTTPFSNNSTAATAERRRKRFQQQQPEATTAAVVAAVSKPNLMQQLSCLWKGGPAISPMQADEKDGWGTKKPQAGTTTLRGVKAQESSSTFVDEDSVSDMSDATDDVHLEMPAPDAPPTAWLAYYEQRLQVATEWTERANLYYATGNLHVQCRNVHAATQAFETEAQILQHQGVAGDALVPIYKSLAKLWTVRQPQRALEYYQLALSHCGASSQADGGSEAQAIRHAMGRLLFQTGHSVEQAMQVSIGDKMGRTTSTRRLRRSLSQK